MSLNFSEKRQAPRRKSRNTNRWMWKVKSQHSRGMELIIASFLPWHLMCLCENKIHLILSLIRQQVYLRICSLTSDCAVKATQSDRSEQYAVVCSGTRKGSSNSNCSVSPLPAPTDSTKSYAMCCVTSSLVKHRDFIKAIRLQHITTFPHWALSCVTLGCKSSLTRAHFKPKIQAVVVPFRHGAWHHNSALYFVSSARFGPIC